MDPMDLSEPGTDREEEDDHEILFPPRVRESMETIPSPARAQTTTDCDIVNMVKTLNGAIAAVSQDTARYNGHTNSCVRKIWQETRP